MFQSFIDGVVKMIQLFGTKPSIWKIMSMVLTVIPSLLGSIVDFKAEDAKTKFDDFLGAFDAYLTDNTKLRAFPHMTVEKEQDFWRNIRNAVQDFGYEELKVPGYYQP